MVTFTPGKFQPVVEVSQRTNGLPAPAETNFSGLEEVALTTLQLSRSSALGSGATVNDPVPDVKISQIIGYLLAARNIVEQLLHIGEHTRTTSVLRNSNGLFLEPLIRAYNFYGHFQLDGKDYVTRGLEELYVFYLFRTRNNATSEVANGTKHTVLTNNFNDIDLSFYSLSSDGDIVFDASLGFKEYILKILQYVSNIDLDINVKLPMLQEILDISTEDALSVFLRKARLIPGFTTPDRGRTDTPTDAHKKAMKDLFNNKPYSSEDSVIPNALFVSAINNAYTLLRRVTLERSIRMRTIGFPKYEGGSASQLAELVDDVVFSTVNLSLVDSTAALAFTTCYGTFGRFKSAPGIIREELRRELVAQSLIHN